MALYHKWDVKNDFAYVLQFFSLISDGLGSVRMDHSLAGERVNQKGPLTALIISFLNSNTYIHK